MSQIHPVLLNKNIKSIQRPQGSSKTFVEFLLGTEPDVGCELCGKLTKSIVLFDSKVNYDPNQTMISNYPLVLDKDPSIIVCRQCWTNIESNETICKLIGCRNVELCGQCISKNKSLFKRLMKITNLE